MMAEEKTHLICSKNRNKTARHYTSENKNPRERLHYSKNRDEKNQDGFSNSQMRPFMMPPRGHAHFSRKKIIVFPNRFKESGS